MKKTMIILAFILLLPQSMASFARPYEDESWVAQNPNILCLGKAYWWNLDEFGKTLDSADFPAASAINMEEPASKHISDAVLYANEARKGIVNCRLEVLGALSILAIVPSTSVAMVFSKSSSCMGYPESWRRSVDSGLLAVEDSISACEFAVSDARAAYGRMEMLGLCGSGYSGPGSEGCLPMESAFQSADNNITEGDFGKMALIRQYSRDLESDLMGYRPDLDNSVPILSLAWGEGGIIQSYRNISVAVQSSVATAEKHYAETERTAEGKREYARSRMKALDSEGLMKISRGPSGVSSVSVGTIAEKNTALSDWAMRLDESLQESKMQHSRTLEPGYLVKSITLAESSAEGYDALAQEAGLLLALARDTVDEQAEEAESEISLTEKSFKKIPPGEEASDLLSDAQNEYSSAGNAGTLGMAFERYKKAAALARSARNAGSFSTELNASVSRAELDSLIGRAEKDGIDAVSEKENLKLIGLLPPADAENAIQSAIDSIVAKARAQYESALLEKRARIYEAISLAGPAAADLGAEMAECEEGMVEGGAIILPASIGRLKKLDLDYGALEATLADYSSETIGNSMSVSANPLVPLAGLDEPSEIILDVVMPNSRAYGGSHVKAQIRMDEPCEFLFSEIEYGRDGVESIRSLEGGKTIAVVFSSVAPYETRRLTFVKKSIIAHALKRAVQSEGLGNGRASVQERVDFTLDSSASGIDLPSMTSQALIDGSPQYGILKPGKHYLTSDRIVEDAYSESVENIKAYRMGTNSLVEYDVRLMPAIDMDSVKVFITSINGSGISSFDIACATGESIREEGRISNTSYFALVSGLKKGREAVLKVRYRVDDTESYVREQLSSIGGLDLGPSANSLVLQAKTQASSGNFTEALALIEKAVSSAREDDKANSKLQSQSDAIEKRLRTELADIQSSLGRSNSTSPFVLRLESRKTEIERALSESNASSLGERIAILQKIDEKWLDKEISSLKKDLYSGYNGLRERLYASGNMTTPPEFLAFEESFRKMETGARLEYGIDAVDKLDSAERLVAGQEALSEKKMDGMRALFDALKSETLDSLGRYLKQAAAAKGTDYSGRFTETEKKVNSLVDEAEEMIDSDPRPFQTSMAELNKSRQRMEATLESLKNESEARMSMISSILSSREIPRDKKAELEAKLDSIRGMASAGDYVNALRAQSSISKELDALEEPEGNGILILGVTGIALLAGIGFYIAKKPKEKKEPRRLTSFSAPHPQSQSKPGQQAAQAQPDRSIRSSQPPGRHQQPGHGGSTPEAR